MVVLNLRTMTESLPTSTSLDHFQHPLSFLSLLSIEPTAIPTQQVLTERVRRPSIMSVATLIALLTAVFYPWMASATWNDFGGLSNIPHSSCNATTELMYLDEGEYPGPAETCSQRVRGRIHCPPPFPLWTGQKPCAIADGGYVDCMPKPKITGKSREECTAFASPI